MKRYCILDPTDWKSKYSPSRLIVAASPLPETRRNFKWVSNSPFTQNGWKLLEFNADEIRYGNYTHDSELANRLRKIFCGISF